MTGPFHVGFLLYPNLTQLDLTGPAQVLSRVPDVRTHYVWKNIEPIPSDAGIALLPTVTFDTCPQLDLLCVPGGAGQVAVMGDEETLTFLRKQAEAARFVTSVCTGSLVLGAAGLIQGYRMACHWMWRDLLPAFGAIPVSARVVRDRNRISGGGVTAGIDFAFSVVAEIWGAEVAKKIQLELEYDPQPPFDAGSPERAGSDLVSKVRSEFEEAMRKRESIAAELTGEKEKTT